VSNVGHSRIEGGKLFQS